MNEKSTSARSPKTDIAFETYGESGSPVLLIMGYTMARDAWSNQVAGLREGHRVAVFDNRGVGESPRFARHTTTMAAMVADAVSVLNALDWQQAHVVGVSMGGMIAQNLALTHRERLSSLTLIASTAGGVVGRLPTAKGLRRFVATTMGPVRGRGEALQKLLYPEEFLASATEEWSRSAMARFTEVPDARTRGAQMAAILGHDTRTRLHELSGLPTLVIGGGADILVRPRECARLATLIPGAHLERIDGAGHGLLHQCPQRVNELLLGHFSTVDRSS